MQQQEILTKAEAQHQTTENSTQEIATLELTLTLDETSMRFKRLTTAIQVILPRTMTVTRSSHLMNSL